MTRQRKGKRAAKAACLALDPTSMRLASPRPPGHVRLTGLETRGE